MFKVKKKGSNVTMVARDKDQLAAFLNNGWENLGEVGATTGKTTTSTAKAKASQDTAK